MMKAAANGRGRWSRWRYGMLLLAVFGLAGSWVALVAQSSSGDVQLVDAWVHETTERRIALHLTLISTGSRADRLVRVSTSVAKGALIFDQLGQEVTELAIPPDSEWVLGTNAPRIELIGLTRALKAHDAFDLQLVLQRGGKLRGRVRVEPAADGEKAN